MPAKEPRSELREQVDKHKKYIAQLLNQLAELRHLAVILEDSNDAITVHDFAGKIIVWNKGAQKMYGWPKAKALKMNIREIVPPEKKNEALDYTRDIAKGKEITSFETKRITADGRILDVWLTATALFNDKGEPTAVATTERDISEQKNFIKEKTDLIKQLQQTNAQLQKTLAETKTLRGIIPICMLCKQIRNDKGYWEQVEVYVHKHSEADFSHGICPDCLKKKYPKIYQKKMLSAPMPRKMLER